MPVFQPQGDRLLPRQVSQLPTVPILLSLLPLSQPIVFPFLLARPPIVQPLLMRVFLPLVALSLPFQRPLSQPVAFQARCALLQAFQLPLRQVFLPLIFPFQLSQRHLSLLISVPSLSSQLLTLPLPRQVYALPPLLLPYQQPPFQLTPWPFFQPLLCLGAHFRVVRSPAVQQQFAPFQLSLELIALLPLARL